jgi:ATP-dependent protease ClpP protease subunit
MKKWFRVDCKVDDPTIAEIHIIDVIGSWDDDWLARNIGLDMGVTARAFVEALSNLPAAVTMIRLHINSPGGDLQAGINIANALRDQRASKGRTVETIIDSIAGSIASVIAMAGSKVIIGDNALMAIHNPSGKMQGTSADMRAAANILDKMRGQIISTYQWHSSMETDAIGGLMDAQTWMDADEAIARGFATEKVMGLKASANLDAGAFANLIVPDKYKARVNALLKPAPVAPVAASATDVLRLCREGDVLDLAERFITASASAEDVQAGVAAERQARAAAAAATADVQAKATTRATQIRALCATAKLTDRAEVYIKSALTIDDIKADLTGLTAKLDRVEIDGSLPADLGGRAKGQINTAEIYAARNRRAS